MSDYELKRIINLTEASSYGDADYLAVDGANGTKKLSKETLVNETVKPAINGLSGVFDNVIAGNAKQLLGSMSVIDKEPYQFRTTGGSSDVGDREFLSITGGTVEWNQLCNGSSVTVTSGHKYYMIKGGVKSVGTSDGTAITGLTSGTDIVIDLTLLFGSTIADYIYSLEQTTAGAGVAWFRQYFGKDYYPYFAPTLKSVEGLQSHDMVGFNQWDEEWESGRINVTTGEDSTGNGIRSKNLIPVFPSTSYHAVLGSYTGASGIVICYYDSSENFISYESKFGLSVNFTTPSDAHYIRFNVQSSAAVTYNHDICINLSWSGYRNGEYEPYVKHTYPLDSTLTLRGIPKLDSANKLYFDGDVYASDGTVTRYLGERAYQEGDVSDGSTMITDGTNTVYKLTTPTTETAEPFTSPQECDDFGTEEFVTTSIVPVGHETSYPANLRDKIQHLPDSTGTAGMYLISEDSQEHQSLSQFPMPATDGTYTLKCTKSGSTVSMSWVADE